MTVETSERGLFCSAVFFCFFALYAITAQQGVSWQDSGEFQYRILAGDYQWYSGIARAHPLYILMARGFVALFPKWACFYAANLFSGLGLALALAVLAHNVARLTRSVWAAVMAVGVLGFAHMAWWLGSVAEVYTWSLAFLMAEVLCLLRYSENRDGRWLIVLFGANGLHWSLHNAALLGLPVYVVLLGSAVRERKERYWGLVCGSMAAWLVGGGMTVWQAGSLLKGTGDPVLVLKSVLFGDGYGRQVLGMGGFALKRWWMNMVLAGVSFLNPCWVFAGWGLLVREWNGKAMFRNALVALTVLHGVFWVRYFVADQATFVLPTLGLLAVWVGVGAGGSSKVLKCESALVEKSEDGETVGNRQSAIGKGREGKETTNCTNQTSRWRFLPNRLTVYRLTVFLLGVVCAVTGPGFLRDAAERSGFNVRRPRVLPFRDEARYWLVPWKQGEDSAAMFVSEAGKQLKAGDVLVADATAAGTLMAAREAGLVGKEWRLITPWSGETEEALRVLVEHGEVRVFVVSPVAGYAPRAVLETARGFEREGVVYRVKGKRGNRE